MDHVFHGFCSPSSKPEIKYGVNTCIMRDVQVSEVSEMGPSVLGYVTMNEQVLNRFFFRDNATGAFGDQRYMALLDVGVNGDGRVEKFPDEN
ncbi:hypothetical protein FRX31_026709 [Thalictrum thalictroides]|uniref:Uncharacterized protein n=1 Tax=Thalictrum thalictroides TaxID=46969 RepID=A0A7J6VHD1_THATH|nr:hypothetical protein FRX31_026709 [Thalictrum thalictroides]